MKTVIFFLLCGVLSCGEEESLNPKMTNNSTNQNTTPTNNGVIVDDFGLDKRPRNTDCLAPNRPPADTLIELTEGESFPADNKAFFPLSGGDFWFDVFPKGFVGRSLLGKERSAYLNISSRILYQKNTELGLLGAAMGPDAKFLYVYYTAGTLENMKTVVSRFPTGEAIADRNSETILLEIDQPLLHNNGGTITFGPDGYLYIGVGDGGDPQGEFNQSAQDLNSLLGKILRIDPSKGAPYAIPDDNPALGGRPEIFAFGFQNPTGLGFDPKTGILWVSDTGKKFQEINQVTPGGNYGWSIKVGPDCNQRCDPIAWQDPYFHYTTNIDSERIIGGFVYRGTKVPDLEGTYVFAEKNSGRVYGIFSDPLGNPVSKEIATVSGGMSAIGQSQKGEMFILAKSGVLSQISGPTLSSETLPLLLSQTGCVDPNDPSKASDSMIAYEPQSPFFSDNVGKERYFSIPEGTKIVIEPNGDWTLPPGSVTMKHFLKDNRIFETRFFVRHYDESYSGYTYRWEGDDAKLLRGATQEDIGGGQLWQFPSRGQCMQCHTEGGGGILGLESAQLDSLFTYERTGRRANQLKTLIEIGVAEKGIRVERLAPPFGEDPIGPRARSYLHTNCASCHRAGQEVKKLDFDLTYSGFFGGLCNEDPLYGDDGVGAKRLIPGNKEKSLLYRVLIDKDADAMPPLGTNLIDERGVELIGTWIDGLEECP